MKIICLLFMLLKSALFTHAQDLQLKQSQRKDIIMLIGKYSQARESKDTQLLKRILAADIDQLVSTGEWRKGIDAAVKGMMKSSAGNPGSRILIVDKIRLLTPVCALVDCRYEIAKANGTARKMWSSFTTIKDKRIWKIAAIRNMLPAGN